MISFSQFVENTQIQRIKDAQQKRNDEIAASNKASLDQTAKLKRQRAVDKLKKKMKERGVTDDDGILDDDEYRAKLKELQDDDEPPAKKAKTEEDYEALTVTKLKAKSKERGLAATGEKGRMSMGVSRMFCSICLGVSPRNGGSPAMSSYSSTPTAQWSSASEAEPSRSTSGATYGSVPHFLCCIMEVERPKSASLMWPVSAMSTFDGLMSLCTTEHSSCRWARARKSDAQSRGASVRTAAAAPHRKAEATSPTHRSRTRCSVPTFGA